MSGTFNSIHECAFCKTPLTFRHASLNVKHCHFCGAVNQKLDGNVIVKRMYPVITSADTVIQPGTTGKWKGDRFTVTGRVRFWFEEHAFNYWTIVFDDQRMAFLEEGYGMYAIGMLIKPETPLVSPAFDTLRVNSQVKLGDKKPFYVLRKDVSNRFDIEGEIWLPENNGSFISVEMASTSGDMVEILEPLKNYRIYIDLSSASFEALELSNLREWKADSCNINCQHCHHSIRVEQFPYAQSAACSNCGALYAYQHDTFTLLTRDKKYKSNPAIPVGRTGELAGIPYKVVGFTHKIDFNEVQSEWREYTLFHPEQGFAFLSEFDGHWTFVKETLNAPVLPDEHADHFVFDDIGYQLFNQYGFRVLNASGCFIGNVMNDENITVREYINPPDMWIREKSKEHNINWFIARHLSADEVSRAFSIEAPPQIGLGVLDPKDHVRTGQIVSNSFFVSIFLVLVFLILSFTHQEKTLFTNQYFFTDSSNTMQVVTEKFHLNRWRSNLEIEVSAPVNNDWFELGATLVNTDNGKEYSIEQGVEYYYGYEDGSSWTEGSRTESSYLDGIPAGNYLLQLQGTRNQLIPDFSVTVRYDVPMYRNLFIILGLLLIWPLIKYFKVRSTEKQRWMNSPYSPFDYENE